MLTFGGKLTLLQQTSTYRRRKLTYFPLAVSLPGQFCVHADQLSSVVSTSPSIEYIKDILKFLCPLA